MTSYRIWIPSKQKYTRMYEINCEQYREILKSIDDDFEFDFTLNQLLMTNMYDKTVNLEEFTVIDRFVMLLQLKIHSCDSMLNLVRACEKCKTQTTFSIDLNKFIDSLAKSIDQSFEKVFQFDTMRLILDVPSIKLNDEFIFDREDFSKRLDFYLYSFIKSLYLYDTDVELDKRPNDEKIAICQDIPLEVMMKVKTEYIDPLHKIFQDLLIVRVQCSNDKCKDELEMHFDVTNMTDVTKILFRDSSSINLLAQFANVSSTCHFDHGFYKSICPAELNIISNMVKKGNEEESAPPPADQDTNLFDQYPLDSAGMVESPSEFS